MKLQQSWPDRRPNCPCSLWTVTISGPQATARAGCVRPQREERKRGGGGGGGGRGENPGGEREENDAAALATRGVCVCLVERHERRVWLWLWSCRLDSPSFGSVWSMLVCPCRAESRTRLGTWQRVVALSIATARVLHAPTGWCGALLVTTAWHGRASLGTLVLKWFEGLGECINPNRSKTLTIHHNPHQSLLLLDYPN
jgi:hypothetical protein